MNNIPWMPINRNNENVADGMPQRVLIFSPTYEEGHELRYRLVDCEFVRLMGDATHWAPLTPPEDSQGV